MHYSWAIVIFSAYFPAFAATPPTVLLAATRAGRVETIDPSTLATLSRISTPSNTNSVAASADGKRLFIAAPGKSGGGCCAILALDSASEPMKEIEWPAMGVTVAGNRVLAQRGNVGIDVFDSQTLQPLPAIATNSYYELKASPNGRSAFGITYAPELSLALFNLVSGQRVVSHVFAPGSILAGTYVGNDYYLFAVEEGEARIHHVRSDTGQFEERVVSMPTSLFRECGGVPYDAAPVGDKIAIYGQFGLKGGQSCETPGGYVLADPGARTASQRLVPELHFRQLVGVGGFLYGLEVGDGSWRQVRLLKLDPASGTTLAERALDPAAWYLTSGSFTPAN